MEYLSKLNRRIFLGQGTDLSSASFEYSLWKYKCHWSTDNPDKEYVATAGKLSVFLHDKVIVLHVNDLVLPDKSLPDMIKKMQVLREVINNGLGALEKDRAKRYIDKRFLNDIEGISDLYTSTVAITITQTHGITFELSSCDHKSRTTLHGRKRAQAFLGRFKTLLDWIVEELESVLAKHAETLETCK